MSEDRDPNIVLITMDTARAMSMSSYGHEKKTTPFLDQLAEENVKYQKAVTQAPWTLPSHASIFSGEYITEHGQYSKDKSFEHINSFTDELSDMGYRNIAVTNIAYLTQDFQFDEMFDDHTYVGGKSLFEDSEIIQKALEGEKQDRWDSTKEKYIELFKQALSQREFKDIAEGLNYVLEKYTFRGDDGAEKTNEIAKRKAEETGEPFFMFLNYIEPHAPHRPPFPYSHKFQHNKLAWKKLLDISGTNMHKYASSGHSPPKEMLKIQRALYEGEINYLDERIKELYNYIQEEHPNTVFIVTADHGEYLYEKGLVNHFGDVHEPVSHVPLIEAYPNQQNKDIEGTVELRGLHDHVLEIADSGFDVMEPTEAVTEYYGAKSSLWEMPEELTQEDVRDLNRYKAASYKNRKKLIAYSNGERKLYQLPEEEKTEDEEAARRLFQTIEDKVGSPEEKNYENQQKEVESEIKEKLEDLGYM
jgi:arylsulfatase A-like enzyme